MLGVQTASGREAPADGADGKRGTAQYAKGGVAERGDALGVQILAQHVAKDLLDLIAGEPLLLDDHGIPRPAVAGREICRSCGNKSRTGEFARICRRRRSYDSFRNRSHGRLIRLCPNENGGMSEGLP